MKKPLVSNRVLVIDDKKGTAGTENYVRVGKGFTNFAKASNSTIDQKFYIDEAGKGTSNKTGMQTIYSLTGDRVLEILLTISLLVVMKNLETTLLLTPYNTTSMLLLQIKLGALKLKSLNVWLTVLTTDLETVVPF